MINPFKEINWHPDTAAKRQFARSLLIGFPIVALVFLAGGRLTHGDWPWRAALAIGGTGFGLGAVFLVFPALSGPFYFLWYGFACCMGIVVGNVAFALVFFGVVTATGFGLKLFRYRCLRRKPDPSATTYWEDAPPPPATEKYFHQY